ERMQQICEFLGVAFEERMGSLEGADRSAISVGTHHTLVRGNTIVSQKKHANALAPNIRAKVNRYIYRWKRSSDGKWPKYPVFLPAGTRPPSLFECWRDRIFYQALIARDHLVATVYSVVPINWARGFRSLRQRSEKVGLLSMSQ